MRGDKIVCDKPVKYKGLDLRLVNFIGYDLRGADFTGANLAGADFTGANLTGANLTGAELDQTNLTNANLTNANLTNTSLTFTNFMGANMTGADFTGCDIDETTFDLGFDMSKILKIPVIDDIHKVVYEAVNKPNALDMSEWHDECGTTHCRAGWVVVLAGKAGLALEKQVGTGKAAELIYRRSDDSDYDLDFNASNEDALEQMRLLAQ